MTKLTTTLRFGGRDYAVKETAIVTPPPTFGAGYYPPGTTVKFTRMTPEGLVVSELFRIEEELTR